MEVIFLDHADNYLGKHQIPSYTLYTQKSID